MATITTNQASLASDELQGKLDSLESSLTEALRVFAAQIPGALSLDPTVSINHSLLVEDDEVKSNIDVKLLTIEIGEHDVANLVNRMVLTERLRIMVESIG